MPNLYVLLWSRYQDTLHMEPLSDYINSSSEKCIKGKDESCFMPIYIGSRAQVNVMRGSYRFEMERRDSCAILGGPIAEKKRIMKAFDYYNAQERKKKERERQKNRDASLASTSRNGRGKKKRGGGQ